MNKKFLLLTISFLISLLNVNSIKIDDQELVNLDAATIKSCIIDMAYFFDDVGIKNSFDIKWNDDKEYEKQFNLDPSINLRQFDYWEYYDLQVLFYKMELIQNYYISNLK